MVPHNFRFEDRSIDEDKFVVTIESYEGDYLSATLCPNVTVSYDLNVSDPSHIGVVSFDPPTFQTDPRFIDGCAYQASFIAERTLPSGTVLSSPRSNIIAFILRSTDTFVLSSLPSLAFCATCSPIVNLVVANPSYTDRVATIYYEDRNPGNNAIEVNIFTETVTADCPARNATLMFDDPSSQQSTGNKILLAFSDLFMHQNLGAEPGDICRFRVRLRDLYVLPNGGMALGNYSSGVIFEYSRSVDNNG